MVLTKKYCILVGFLVVFLAGTLVYFGWTKQKSGPGTLQPEETKLEPVRKIAIPSSLEPGEVMEQFVPYVPPWGEKISAEDYPYFWGDYFELPYPKEGFIKGVATAWQGGAAWIKKDGTGIGPPDTPSCVLELVVLKYEKPEFAQKDYNRMSIKEGFSDSIFEGVTLKTKLGIPTLIQKRPDMTDIEPEQYQQYLLYSNNFIIYAFGLKEAAEDAMIRVIDQYAVE